jgi:predicted HTH domain antitoxin
MSVVIPDEVLYKANMTASELKLELAVLLFEKKKLTLGQASRLAGVPQLQFQLVLASRQIPVHYDVADLETDVQTLKALGRL